MGDCFNETKLLYHIDEEETPYLVKIPVPSEQVKLEHVKNVLNRHNCKFFFKSMDDDFGVVKEEIIDDNAKLPCFNGRVVCWVVAPEGSGHSDSNSQCTVGNFPRAGVQVGVPLAPDGRPMSFHANRIDSPQNGVDQSACTSETESTISGLPRFPRHGTKLDRRLYHRPQYAAEVMRRRQHNLRMGMDGSSVMTSELDSTTFYESEDDRASRISSSTDITSVSRMIPRQRRKRKMRHRAPVSRTSSVTSITESSMSLNVITVVLNMDTVNFLGISIVGHSNTGGDGGIYVGSIMKGGAVALDGRIEPGDMILQVNDVSFENMSNDDAVRVLREAVQRPGPIKLVVAKNWDPNPQGYFTIPRAEPVRPIDPGAWVAHTNAMRNEMLFNDFPGRPPSATTYTSNTESIATLVPENDRFFEEVKLDIKYHDPATIVRAMARPDSGLDIHDRTWLKITIKDAFLGSDVVDWLHTNVVGLSDRREAKKYASRILKEGLIRHTVNKITFSEQCYYTFGDLLCGSLAAMRINSGDDCAQSELGGEHGGLPPLPPLTAAPPTPQPWVPYPPSFASSYNPLPYKFQNEAMSLGSLSGPQALGGGIGCGAGGPPTARSDANSTASGGSAASSGGSDRRKAGVAVAQKKPGSSGHGSGSDDTNGGATPTASGFRRPVAPGQPQPPSRALNSVPPDLASSKQSFQIAMNNPCEFFVDVM